MDNTLLENHLSYNPTFVISETGELDLFKPVLEKLQANGRKFTVLTFGTAEGIIQKNNYFPGHIQNMKSLGIELLGEKNKYLSEKDLDFLKTSITSKALYSGVHHKVQRQLLDAWNRIGDHKISVACWDNFEPNGESPYFEEGRKTVELASYRLVPSSFVLENFEGTLNIPESRTYLGGQPSLKSWKEQIASVDQAAVRSTLNVSRDRDIYLYMGGYAGEEDYQNGFRFFADCWKKNNPENGVLVLTTHPRSPSGEFEKQVLDSLGVKNYIHTSELSSPQVIAVSSKVFCHKTTACLKTAVLGLPVAHVVEKTQGQAYSNVAVEAGVVPCLGSSDEFAEFFTQENRRIDEHQVLEQLGIPEDSLKSYVDFINTADWLLFWEKTQQS